MRIFFAVSPSKQYFKLLREENVENVLVSYAFIKNPYKLLELMNGYEPKRLTIDSGAFSVWSNGGHVNIDSYAEFCLNLKQILPSTIELAIVNLDVLPGQWGFVPSQKDIDESAEKGWQNMLYLEEKGLKVIHVFHQHENFELLDRIKNHSDYIGISPANDVSNAEKLKWMNKVFSQIKNTVKTHGFAVTSHNQIYQYPYFSVDSSTWTCPARFGRIPIMNERLEVKSFAFKNINDVEKFWSYIKDIGIEAITDINWNTRVRIAIKTYQRLQEITTKLWKERGIIWN